MRVAALKGCLVKASQPAGKPNSVPPPPSQATEDKPLRACPPKREARRWDDHSSRPAIARGLWRPTRWLRTDRPDAPPYLVLLREGFCLPPVLPRARCALTAPFHPYPSTRAPFGALARGGIFSVPLIRQVALPGRYPAHCPLEFGLSSRPGTTPLRTVSGPGGRLADCDGPLSQVSGDLGSWVLGLGSWVSVSGLGSWVSGLGSWVLGLGSW